MKLVYVLSYLEERHEPGGYKIIKPYAVFEDKVTAERMKRDGDEVLELPYIENS